LSRDAASDGQLSKAEKPAGAKTVAHELPMSWSPQTIPSVPPRAAFRAPDWPVASLREAYEEPLEEPPPAGPPYSGPQA